RRVDLDQAEAVAAALPEDLLALDEALERLSQHDPVAGKLVQLRYFAGLSIEQAAEILDLSTATAYRHWTFARAWLHAQLAGGKVALKVVKPGMDTKQVIARFEA